MRGFACVAGAAAITLMAGAAPAAETHFGSKQIVIAGSSRVAAVALNNKSVIAGNYTDANGNTYGFIQSGSTLTVLPPPIPTCQSCIPYPAAINAAGDVVGGAGYGAQLSFLWRNGAYVQAGGAVIGYGREIGINDKGEIFYDDDEGDVTYPWAGYPGAFMQIDAPASFPVLTGLNDKGVLVGSYFPYPAPTVFTDTAGAFVNYLPPGAVSSFSGAINDRGDVAGLYQDKRGAIGGFVARGGVYTRFVLPGADVYHVNTVKAINNSGRVVGVYTNAAKSVQRVFHFNGATLSLFGAFPVNDSVSVALNDEGAMLVTDNSTYTSWRVLCGGAGC